MLADLRILGFTESVASDTKGTLGSKGTGDFTLELGSSGINEGGLIDDTVFGSVVLGLDGFEEGFFSTEDLDSGSRALSKVDETSSVADKPGTNELSNNSSQIGSEGLHSVFQVFLKTGTVVSELKNLITERNDVFLISFSDFSSHGDFGSILDVLLNVFRKYS